MLQCKSFTSLFPHVSEIKYIRANVCDFLFSNQIRYHSPETRPLSPLKMTCLSLSVFLLVPFLLNSEIPPLKTQYLVAFLPEHFKFSKDSGSIHQLEILFLTLEDF